VIIEGTDPIFGPLSSLLLFFCFFSMPFQEECLIEPTMCSSLEEQLSRYAIPSLTLTMKRHSPRIMVLKDVPHHYQSDTLVLKEGETIPFFSI
jgi:hypothetical protein